jgi:hypothetical protein
MEWTDNEEGPDCFCGNPTVVKKQDDGSWLLCLFHTHEAGTMFPLPPEKPDGWPTIEHLAEIGIRAAEHSEPEDGYICICQNCHNKRMSELEKEE